MHGADEITNRRGERVDLSDVRKLLERIVDRWNPRQIWLFGSRARGHAHAASDWDFLVVVPDETPDTELDPRGAWQVRKQLRVAADILLCTFGEFAAYRSVPNTLAYEAFHHGVLVHER